MRDGSVLAFLAAILLTLPSSGDAGGIASPQRARAARGAADVLIVGGVDQFNGGTATAEFYDGRHGKFNCAKLGGVNKTTGGCKNTMAQARSYASVASLMGAKVLVAGGNGVGVTCFNSAEVYDPASRTFTPTGSMTDAHCFAHTTTVLQNGEVLIAGGEDQTGNLVNTADLYNPATGTFDCSGLGGADPNTGFCLNTLTDARFLDAATLLMDGRVLITGGNDGSIVNTAEIFDPVSGTFGCSSLGGPNATTGFCNNTMTDSRENHTATLIVTGARAGGVLIVGGLDAGGVVLQTAEIFDPRSGSFVCSNGAAPGASGCPTAMTSARYLHTATLLDPTYVKGRYAGDILITGGEDAIGTALASAEVYDPVAGTFAVVGSMTTSRALHTATLITAGPRKGRVLIAGGVDNSGNSLSSAELFNPKTGTFAATRPMTVARSSAGTGALP